MKSFIIGLLIALAISILLTKWTTKLVRDRKAQKIAHAKQWKNFKSARECLAFFKVRVPEGYIIYHLNKDKNDNRFNNLEVISRNELLNRIRKVNNK